jgi:uncharacterized membrane protein
LSFTAQTAGPPSASTTNRWPKVLSLTLVLVIGAAFVIRYVFRYYLHYNESAFTDPVRGAANYWRMRGWLLLHITSGMLALLLGPWQFSTRLRRRYLQLHRVSGRVYVGAVMLGSAAALRLALATTFGKAFGFGLACLALAWTTTTLMAFAAARQRQISIHKEWMIRSYVVTFAFVTFRIFSDYPPMMNWLPDADRYNFLIWACWAIPLLATDLILQIRRMRTMRMPTSRS